MVPRTAAFFLLCGICILDVQATDSVWIDCTEDGGGNPCTDEHAFCYAKGLSAICRCQDGYLEDRRNFTRRKCVKANGRWLNCDRNLDERSCSDPNAYCPSSGKLGAECKCKEGYIIDRRRFNDWKCIELSEDTKPFKCSTKPPPCGRNDFGYKDGQCFCLPDIPA